MKCIRTHVQVLDYKLENIFLINFTWTDGSILFSALKKKPDTLKQGVQTILGTQTRFLIAPPPSQCKGTHFKLIHTVSVILILFCVFGDSHKDGAQG